MSASLLPEAEVFYPESDGQPMGENTVQVRWINDLYNGFDAHFAAAPDVFVAADLFWYPVRGDARTVTAPDVLIAFGRPKGDRGSYKQWEEGGVAPQVVVEVLSPGNDFPEMQKKLLFYQRYGVEEYYAYEPELHTLEVWVRAGAVLRPVAANGFVSPRLGVRFEVSGGEPMRLVRPDGSRFLTYREILARVAEEQERTAAGLARAAAERERAGAERERADAQQARADALAARLRELGVDPDTL